MDFVFGLDIYDALYKYNDQIKYVLTIHEWGASRAADRILYGLGLNFYVKERILAMKQIDIFDSTLRDGAQGEGISFSVQDKIAIAKALDSLGVKYIEAGNPGSNPKDLEFFEKARQLKLEHSRIVAFGSTRRKGIRAEDDANLAALLKAGTDIVAVFGKCWDLHVTEVINTTVEESLAMIYDTCKFLRDNRKRVIFDAEHFFDGYKCDQDFALTALSCAVDGGAECLTLCDTNGGSYPDEIFRIVKTVCNRFPNVRIGIHTHNDRGMAVANSVMAVKAGAVQVQGTYLGYGERCGNANLSTVIPDLMLTGEYECIPSENLKKITMTAREIGEISNTSIKNSEPFVGISAFSHKAGMHADGVLKLPRSFEHVQPEKVGNARRFLMSEISGRNAVLERIRKIDPRVEKSSRETTIILSELKKMEQQGYQYEGADSSLEMLIRRGLGRYKPFFELKNYKINSGRPCESDNCSATATVKVSVNGADQLMAAEGNGPISAMDNALRSALEVFYPSIKKMYLIDYKVRVMDPESATAATVRVLITSSDGKNVWSTVGVSADVVEASRIALTESIEYYLIQEKAGA